MPTFAFFLNGNEINECRLEGADESKLRSAITLLVRRASSTAPSASMTHDTGSLHAHKNFFPNTLTCVLFVCLLFVRTFFHYQDPACVFHSGFPASAGAQSLADSPKTVAQTYRVTNKVLEITKQPGLTIKQNESLSSPQVQVRCRDCTTM